MKEFEPSKDFVSTVMRNVHAYERSQAFKRVLLGKLLASRPFRYAMSGGGVLIGVFIPVACH
jgi:hypothetical protein